MFDDAARKLLEKPLTARMSTIDDDGCPHIIPVWFMMDGDEIVITSVRKTVKVGHIQRNPKGAIQIGGDPTDDAGYLLKGTFSLEEDPDYAGMKALTNRYEAPEQAARDIALWSTWDMILIRFKPQRVIKVI